MSDRDAVVIAVLARARRGGKRVFGFSADKASCAQVDRRGVPTGWGWVCVEGDTEWQRLPAVEGADEEAA